MTEYGDLAHLLPPGWTDIVTRWFQEDSTFDYGGFVVGESPETATLYGKSKVRQNLSTKVQCSRLGRLGRSPVC